MNDDQIKSAFAAFDRQHPFYLAVLALLAKAVEEEQGPVTNPDLTDAGRHFNCGRLAQAIDFRTAFMGVMTDALAQVQAEIFRQELLAARRKAEKDS